MLSCRLCDRRSAADRSATLKASHILIARFSTRLSNTPKPSRQVSQKHEDYLQCYHYSGCTCQQRAGPRLHLPEPENDAKQLTERWPATGYKSLHDMLDPISPAYGNSLDTAEPIDVRGFTKMWWQNDECKEGFLGSHYGPCEGWIDDTMVFHYDDCVSEFPGFSAKIPTDYFACIGDKCLFVFYWLAVHSLEWQIYKQCVPISSGGTGEVAGEAFTKDQMTPEATTAAPLTTDFTQVDATAAPASTPATVTSTETTGTGCKRRMLDLVAECCPI